MYVGTVKSSILGKVVGSVLLLAGLVLGILGTVYGTISWKALNDNYNS